MTEGGKNIVQCC